MGTKVAVGSHVWIPDDDPEVVWIDGEITSIQGQEAKVVLSNGKTITAKLDSMHTKDTELPAEGIEDMTRLSYLHEPGVLDNLRIRYYNNDIYTYVGGILIAINPFQKLAHLEGIDLMNKYKGCNLGELPPHIFAIGDVVYRAMINEKRNNSVLVSGESGAGKTEATKYLMRYLAYLGGTTGKGERTVEEKVLESNPVLEAFGNAKTVRNNNSSRFGKFVEIQFDERGKICGAAVRTYLLERSRVCQANNPERSYHIFYFLCAAPPDHKARFQVGEPQEYHYLNQSQCFKVDRIDDTKEYHELRHAMDVVGMSFDEQEAIFRTVAAILHLGNVEFVKGKEPDSSALKDDKSRNHLKTAAELLKCDLAGLEKALISKRIVTRDETIDRALDPSSAVVSRDGLAKQLYSRLFDWLVQKINVSIGQDPNSKMMIGVLDIYGFESFATNSFEQLCINFTNEKLQQHFNQHVFKGEQAEYNKEEIDWSYIEFTDNQDILDLIEKKGGVLSLLDEACVMPRATHETFCQNLAKKFKDHKRFSTPRIARSTFTISHFAGDVTYQSDYFLEKNKDFVVPEQNELLNASACPFVSSLFPITEESKSSKFSSIGLRFKMQLQQLMETLNTTDPHYVRCVKPNTKLKPSIYENAPILQQLQCGGVLEAIKISCQGFPTRRTFAEFLKRFTILAPSVVVGIEEKEACRKILEKVGLERYQIGKTKVFLRAGQMAELDARRTEVLGRAATKIERKWKTFITRKNYLIQREKCTFIETIVRGMVARSKFEHMRRVDASIKVQKYWRRFVTRKSYLNKKACTIVIQAGFRALSAHMELDFRRKKRAATQLQANWRRQVKYTSYKTQKKAAITFQSWWRRRLAKKELKRLKIIAKEQREEQARLAKELEALKAKMEAERLKAELERIQAEKERAEREAAEAAAFAAAEKERKEREEKERIEREAKEEKERIEREAREEKERIEREAREEKERIEREAREEKERLEREAREERERIEREAKEEKERIEREAREAREKKEREEKEERDRKEREEREFRERQEREEREARERKEREEREEREARAAAAAAAAAAIAAAEAMKSEKIEELNAQQEQLKAKLEEENREKENILNAQAELQQKLEGLKETIKSLEETSLTEKQEHDATKKALALKSEELVKYIEETDKRIEELQKDIEKAKEDSAAKEELLAERQDHDTTKKALLESQSKNKELGEKIEDFESKIVQLKKDLERFEEISKEKESMLQTEKQEHKTTQNDLTDEKQAHNKTKKALEAETEEHNFTKKSLEREKQEHDLTKKSLAEEKQEHEFTKKALTQEKQEHNSTKNGLEKEKQEHDETKSILAKEKREHDSTKDLLSESQRKIKEWQNDNEDSNKKISTLQLDLQRSKEETASTEAMLRTERQEHDTTKRSLASSQQKNDEMSRKIEDFDRRIVEFQGTVLRLEDEKARKESILETERQEHDLTKRKFTEYQDKNDELMRKNQGAEQRVIELQIEVKRYQEEAGATEVMLQREKQEHKLTKEELTEFQINNKKLVRETDDANDKCDRLQRNINRLEEALNAKDELLQKKEDEMINIRELLNGSHERNEGLIENIKDANKKIELLQENVQRLGETIASKETMLQKEKQDHDLTKKLLKESQEKIDELLEKIRDANKKIDRLEDHTERLEEAKASKETLFQEKQQELDALKKLLNESQEKIEELEKKIKDGNRRIEKVQDEMERLQETITAKEISLQTERQEHDATKKVLKDSLNKKDELMDEIKDANKRADRLEVNVERLEETVVSKETLFQTEKEDHNKTKNLLKESKEESDELTNKIRDINKKYDRLQDNVERLEEAKASNETLLQTKQQELDMAKKLLNESHEKIEEYEKKLKEANKRFDALHEDMKRLDETIASKETLLQKEKLEHEATKKLLKESNEKHEELMDQIKEANKRAGRIQDTVERLEETVTLKNNLMQTEKQEHEETKKLLKDSKEKNEELLQQIKDINKKVDRHQDAVERLQETIASKEGLIQAEKLEHEATKKLFKESKEKYEELSDKMRDSDKKYDRLQDKIERLEETLNSKDAILQTEKTNHEATKNLLKGSQEEIVELGKQIRDYNKKMDRLQDNMERLEETASLKETLLQKERQEHETTKKSLKESQDENEKLSKKIREISKSLDRLEDNAERFEEIRASKEALLQTERQEHESTKKLLTESRDKIGELEYKNKDATKKFEQFQVDIQRLDDIINSKEESLQAERQEHDFTKKALKSSQDEYKELLKQIDENRERVNNLQNDMQRLRESEIGKEAQLQTEQRLHDSTKRELTESKEKIKELLEKVEITDQKITQLQLDLKRLEEEKISKDALIQIEKREHEATQRALAQAKDYSDELIKRNDVSNNRIYKLQDDITRYDEKAKEIQEETLKGRLEIYEAKKQAVDAEQRSRDLTLKIEDSNRTIYQLQETLKRMEENVKQKETMLQTEKQQNDRAKKSVASSQVKIDQLEQQIAQFQNGANRVEQDAMGKIQTEKNQHDMTKQALNESQKKNQELLYKLESSERKIEQLNENIKRLEESQYTSNSRGFSAGRNEDYNSYDNPQTSNRRGEAAKFTKQQPFIPPSLLYADEDVRKAFLAAQQKSTELVSQLDEAEKTIETLQETINNLEEKAFNLEQENKMLRQTGVKGAPNLRTQFAQKQGENGFSAPNSPHGLPRTPMSTFSRDLDPEDREQSTQLEKQQQELLIRSISKHLGFVNGSPVAANLIYKCLSHWKSFESDKNGAFDHIIQTINTATEVQDDNETLAYWLSNLSTLVLLLQKTQKFNTGPATSAAPQRRYRRMSRSSSMMSNVGGGASGTVNFTQKVTSNLEKLFNTIKENLKTEISPSLNLCIQAPKVSRMTSMKGVGLSGLGSMNQGASIIHWQNIINVLNNYMSILKTNYVPSFVIQKLFAEIFKIIDVHLFNGLVLRRECCSSSNGDFVKAGLEELQKWCLESNQEYVGSIWNELRHIQQAVEFLVVPQKQWKTLSDISSDICPNLTISQLHRLSALYWDDKYGTNVLSQQATTEMSQKMAREPNNTFMLDEDTSSHFSSEELSRSIDVVELRDSDLPTQIKSHPVFAFFLQRNY